MAVGLADDSRLWYSLRMTNTKPFPSIHPAFRPTGGTLLIIALLFLGCDVALGGGPAMAAALYNFIIVPCVAFNDAIFSILDSITDFFAHLADELNPTL